MAGLYTIFTVKLFFAVLAITGTTLLSSGKVNARPYIYMDSYSHGNTHQKCIAQAKTVLQENGFGNFDEDQYLEDRVSEITGYHNDESLTVEIQNNLLDIFAKLDGEVLGLFHKVEIDSEFKSQIEDLISQRNIARVAKDWELSDSIRDKLTSLGVEIQDSSDGTTWKLI